MDATAEWWCLACLRLVAMATLLSMYRERERGECGVQGKAVSERGREEMEVVMVVIWMDGWKNKRKVR